MIPSYPVKLENLEPFENLLREKKYASFEKSYGKMISQVNRQIQSTRRLNNEFKAETQRQVRLREIIGQMIDYLSELKSSEDQLSTCDIYSNLTDFLDLVTSGHDDYRSNIGYW